VHNNFFFLKELSKALQQKLVGFTLVSCFSQNKEELILELNDSKTSFLIKASLQSDFCCLSFPAEFNRARKNSVDLFPALILKKITDVRQFQNERSFSFEFEGGIQLLFKMHGNRANIILFENDIATALFRNHLQSDSEIKLPGLDRIIDWSKENFLANQEKLREVYFTFGKEVWNRLDEKGFADVNIEEKWTLIEKVLKQLICTDYFIVEYKGKLIFSLLPFGKIIKQIQEPIEAVTEFFSLHATSNAFYSEKLQALKQLLAQRSACSNFISKNREKLNELINDTHYQIWADLIMANMNQIKPGVDSVTVDNFYDDNKPISIKLKKECTPQKNAEIFYRKGKNQQIEIQKLKDSIAGKEKTMAKLDLQITIIEGSTDLKELRKVIGETNSSPKKEKQPKLSPYHEVEFKGFKIWIGRNAESNDVLTLKHSFKEDLWLHAKDVAGSHVLIKHQSGKSFPKDVIERAAQLAAFHSKRKNESLCPVTVTPKKFVRKRKGDPAGAVVVEREEVILVEPSLK
jgi:predicted ribosome quality control (RQC) complex YloA/Tae2 family protein